MNISFFLCRTEPSPPFPPSLSLFLFPGLFSALSISTSFFSLFLSYFQEDSQFLMEEEINRENLISFVIKHTKKKLNRFLRSSHNSKSRSLTRYRFPVRKGENCTHTDTESCVPELNSNNFIDFVMNPNKV